MKQVYQSPTIHTLQTDTDKLLDTLAVSDGGTQSPGDARAKENNYDADASNGVWDD